MPRLRLQCVERVSDLSVFAIGLVVSKLQIATDNPEQVIDKYVYQKQKRPEHINLAEPSTTHWKRPVK
jgi:hypothetical protein